MHCNRTALSRPDPEPVVWTPSALDTVRYAAAMWEFQRLHFDPEWAGREGLDRPIVQGPLLGTRLAQLVEDWARPRGGRLTQLRWRNQSNVDLGEEVTLSGQVVATADDGALTLDLAITSARNFI